MAEPWTSDENSVLVEAYMRLVETLMDGDPVVKTRVYRQVAERIDRGPKSVEFKMLNVSGVLVSLGYGFPHGLTPAHNFQSSLVDIVQGELAQRPRVEAFLTGSGVSHVTYSKHALQGGQLRQLSDVDVAEDTSRPTAAALASPADDVLGAPAELDDPQDFAVEGLWDFATGGGDVAAAPGKPPVALRGPTPAAVGVAMDWMRAALDGDSPRRRMLFLVGGPGGGKSFVASALTAGLQPLTSHDDGLAHRSYTFQAPGGALRVINDATIPPTDSITPTNIAAELESSREDFVIACVNRGILVDEAARESGNALGSQITNWLRSNYDAETGPIAHVGELNLRPVGTSRSFVRQARITEASSGDDIDLLAVFVDACSLLEEQPQSTRVGGTVAASPYEVAVFNPGLDRSQTPAGQLLAAVAGTLGWDSHGQWDPIASNVASISSPLVRDGILSILRAAEMASSQLFSYREVWGVVARAVAGPLPESIAKAQLTSWFESEMADAGDQLGPDFKQMRRLAAVRMHEALFGEDRVGRHPVLRATTAVDPARDMVPGSPEAEDLGWATPVMEAFAGAELGASPLARLRSSASTPALQAMVTPFDELLDDACVRWVHEQSDVKARAEATSWYGRYLTRMVALAHGYPAFAADIQAWTRARKLSPGLPPDLQDALTTLVSPRRDPNDSHSKSLIPLFASRTEPLRGRSPEPTLSVVVKDVSFTTSVDGEHLFLHLKEGSKPLGAMVFDLDLMREAMASSGGWTGMTDATESTEPRLERFRSLRLIPRNRGTNDLRIAGPFEDIPLTVKGQL